MTEPEYRKIAMNNLDLILKMKVNSLERFLQKLYNTKERVGFSFSFRTPPNEEGIITLSNLADESLDGLLKDVRSHIVYKSQIDKIIGGTK